MKHKQTMFLANDIAAWLLRHEGLTFKRVGERLDPPVSPSRARQLYIQGASRVGKRFGEDFENGYVWLPWLDRLHRFDPDS